MARGLGRRGIEFTSQTRLGVTTGRNRIQDLSQVTKVGSRDKFQVKL